jgi:hypothetical protein
LISVFEHLFENRFEICFEFFMQVSIVAPISPSLRSFGRWMQSSAVVARYSRAKQSASNPATLPPLERMNSPSFRKSLSQAPLSRVLSPDPKPIGNVETALKIGGALRNKAEDLKTARGCPRIARIPLRIKRQVGMSQFAEDKCTDNCTAPSALGERSTPSPPPLPVMRLGGIISGDKNVFIAEEKESGTHSSHFGRSNVFSK